MVFIVVFVFLLMCVLLFRLFLVFFVDWVWVDFLDGYCFLMDKYVCMCEVLCCDVVLVNKIIFLEFLKVDIESELLLMYCLEYV